MKNIENDDYRLLGEYIAPEAKRLLDELNDKGIRFRTSIVDEIRRAWPWGPHGTFTRVAIFVRPGELKLAQDIQDRVLRIEI